MLAVSNLNSGYEKVHILYDINIQCNSSEIVSIIGPNGSGKTTLLKTIVGLTNIYSGTILFNNIKINNIPSYKIAKIGISYLPQGNNIFPSLSVYENLRIGCYLCNSKDLKETIDEIFSIFPILREYLAKKASMLSGGERQMLGIAMNLLRKPKLLMLDEPLAGLSPLIAKNILNKLVEIKDKLKIGIIIVEQNISKVLEISDRIYLLASGKIVFSGKNNELLENKDMVKLYMGLLSGGKNQ